MRVTLAGGVRRLGERVDQRPLTIVVELSRPRWRGRGIEGCALVRGDGFPADAPWTLTAARRGAELEYRLARVGAKAGPASIELTQRFVGGLGPRELTRLTGMVRDVDGDPWGELEVRLDWRTARGET